MKQKIEISNIPDELKESGELYLKALSVDDYPKLDYPSLKYALYNLKISKIFKSKIAQIKTDIETLKDKVKSYAGNRINIIKEKKHLDEISEKLTLFEEDELKDYDYYSDYLITIAKKADIINNEMTKRIYVKTSEEIIYARIQKFMKLEKSLILFKDIINQIRNIFNI